MNILKLILGQSEPSEQVQLVAYKKLNDFVAPSQMGSVSVMPQNAPVIDRRRKQSAPTSADQDSDDDEEKSGVPRLSIKFIDDVKAGPFGVMSTIKLPADYKAFSDKTMDKFKPKEVISRFNQCLFRLELETNVVSVTGDNYRHQLTLDYSDVNASVVKRKLDNLSVEYGYSLTMSADKIVTAELVEGAGQQYKTEYKLQKLPNVFYFIDDQGNAVHLNLLKHGVIVGQSRSGKTMTCIAMLYQLLSHYKRQQYGKVMILNADRDKANEGTLEIFKSHCRVVKCTFSSSQNRTINALMYAVAIVRNRGKDEDEDSREEYDSSQYSGKEWEPLHIVIDELDAFIEGNPIVVEILHYIITKGGKYNVWLLCLSHSGCANILTTNVLSNFFWRMVHRLDSKVASRVALNEREDAAFLAGNGHVALLRDDQITIGQVPLVDMKEVAKVCKNR